MGPELAELSWASHLAEQGESGLQLPAFPLQAGDLLVLVQQGTGGLTEVPGSLAEQRLPTPLGAGPCTGYRGAHLARRGKEGEGSSAQGWGLFSAPQLLPKEGKGGTP